MNGHRSQYRFFCGYLPAQRAVFSIQAIDRTVCRTEYHDSLADSRCTYDAFARCKAPQFLTVLQDVCSQATQIIAYKYLVLFYRRRAIDTDTCLYHPLFLRLGILLVHGEIRILLGFSLTVVVRFGQGERCPLFGRFTDSLGKDLDGVRSHFIDTIALLVILVAQITTHQDARNTVVPFVHISMIMSANEQANIKWAYGIRHFIPVVHIPFRQWIVSDQNDRLVLASLCHTFRHPTDVLRYHMSVGHTHQRTGVEPQEEEALVFEFKAFVAEDFTESRTAGITPFGFVITQHDIILHFQ